jgi:hypothetical protein
MDNDYEQLLAHARVLCNGTENQQENGRKILDKILLEVPGTYWAEKARNIMNQCRSNLNAPTEIDQELKDFLKEWRCINSIYDSGLAGFLEQIKNKPKIIAALKPRIISDFRRWIPLVLEKVLNASEHTDASENGYLLKVLRMLPQSCRAELKDKLHELELAIFTISFKQIQEKIQNSCKEWNFTAAEAEFFKLDSVPETFQEAKKRLQKQIDDSLDLFHDTKSLSDQIPSKVPHNWQDIPLFVESFKKLKQFRIDKKIYIPAQWLEKLDNQFSLLREAILNFLKTEANSAINIQDVRQFRKAYEKTKLTDLDEFIIEKEWFGNFSDSFAEKIKNDIRNADTIEKLEILRNEYLQNLHDLPLALESFFTSLSDEFYNIWKTWDDMLKGKTCPSLESLETGILPMSTAFRKAIPDFEKIQRKIEDADGLISDLSSAFNDKKNDKEADSSAIEQACQDAIRISNEVLKTHSSHAMAKKLLEKAEHKLVHVRIENALAHWNIDEFMELCAKGGLDPLYTQSCESYGIFENLTELAGLTKQEFFQDVKSAADWWSKWKIIRQQIIKHLPEVLNSAINKEEYQRKTQWHSLLEEFISIDHEPFEYRKIIKILDKQPDELELDSYLNLIIHMEKKGIVLKLIKEGQFTRAAQEIGQMEPEHSDTRCLTILLEIKKAADIQDKAELIIDNWRIIFSYFEENDAVRMIMDAVKKAWERRFFDILQKLISVANRALETNKLKNPGNVAQIQEWTEWLEIEADLRRHLSVSGVDRLLTYIKDKKNSADLPVFLNGMLNHWKAENNLLMLVWAISAFGNSFPHLIQKLDDPKKKFSEHTDSIAQEIMDKLSIQQNISMNELNDFLEQMNIENAKWNDFKTYCDRLPVITHGKEPSGLFKNTMDKLKDLIESLKLINGLKETDLRTQEAGANWNRLATLLSYLKGISMRETLLKELEKITPLTELKFLEDQIMAAADRCGSADDIDLDEEWLFDKLGKLIREMIEKKFEKAGAKNEKMWHIISSEYFKKIYDRAGISIKEPDPPDLEELANIMDKLQEEENVFRQQIGWLFENRPAAINGGFDPERHDSFLNRFPEHKSCSIRTYRLFDRVMLNEQMRIILEESKNHLPDWIKHYLERGIS